MKYENVKKATFLRRPNRFIAEVDIDGVKEIVHVKNTGRCKELLIPGCEVWLTAPGSPNRKTKYDLIAVRKFTGVLFNIDSQAPNKVVKEWLSEQRFSLVLPEYSYGDSRLDFYMESKSGVSKPEQHPMKAKAESSKPELCLKEAYKECSEPEHYHIGINAEGSEPERFLMEVKGCTHEIDGIGYFPDAPTERGVKHIRALIQAQKDGYNSIIAFVIQMDGVKEVRPQKEIHPEFAAAMKEAEYAGVKTLFLACHVEPDELTITKAYGDLI